MERATDLAPDNHKEAAMSQQEISSKDQKCISQCILKHWREHSKTHPSDRPDAYEQCLTDCRICS